MKERFGQLRHHAGNRRQRMLAIGVATLLSVPVIAMRFTDAVDWTMFDFAAAAMLLGGGAFAYDRGVRDLASRTSQRIAIALVFLLIGII